ncbi:MAG: RagB/SusD family nutrient uptake outer membrane protein [Butyricimonas faecihominis]
MGADRCYWRTGRSSSGNFKVEAQQGEEFGLRAKRITGTAPENLTGYWLKKGTCSEAELFNYSSTVAGFGENPMILIRMAELYLISAEAWNEYLDAPDEEHVYNTNVVQNVPGYRIWKFRGLSGIVIT